MEVTGMAHLFLSGHGGWHPKLGYTKVPADCSVNFYTHFAKLLITGMEYQILRGTYTEVESTFGQWTMVPNMKLYGQPEQWTKRSEKELKRDVWGQNAMVFALDDEDDEATLSEIFAEINNGPRLPENLEFHWLACSEVQLRKAGGADIGFNAGDFNHDKGSGGRYRNQSKRGKWKDIRGELKR
jgi:hypothetical protein